MMMSKSKIAPALAMISLLTLGVDQPSVLEAQTPPRGPDFNNDAFDDIAIGTPNEAAGSFLRAGMVNIGYGSNSGLAIPANHLGFLNQNTLNIADTAELDDTFGLSLAWGDFNGDCFDDLVVGSPGETLADKTKAGAIHVLFGSLTGLTGNDSQFLHRDIPGIVGVNTAFTLFGYALAAGDFDDDGFDDVAVNVYGDTADGGVWPGSVYIFYGSPSGLTTANDQFFSAGGLGLEVASFFGESLAAGDFDCDGKDDLAIGFSHSDPNGVTNAGKVVVLHGTGSGLSATGMQEWYQGNNGVAGVAEENDFFGYSLATGNWNNDTSAGRECLDLAIGVAYEDVGSLEDAGAVQILYGGPVSGLQTSSPSDQIFIQDDAALADVSESEDRFGLALVTGRLNQDAFDDLVVGVPGESSSGAVAILRGSAGGLTATGNVLWDQNTSGITNSITMGDDFGEALGYAANLDPNGATLFIGVRFEDFLSLAAAGYVHACTVDSHNNSGMVILEDNGLSQLLFGGSDPEADDRFGETLVAPRKVPFHCS